MTHCSFRNEQRDYELPVLACRTFRSCQGPDPGLLCSQPDACGTCIEPYSHSRSCHILPSLVNLELCCGRPTQDSRWFNSHTGAHPRLQAGVSYSPLDTRPLSCRVFSVTVLPCCLSLTHISLCIYRDTHLRSQPHDNNRRAPPWTKHHLEIRVVTAKY